MSVSQGLSYTDWLTIAENLLDAPKFDETMPSCLVVARAKSKSLRFVENIPQAIAEIYVYAKILQ